MEKKKTTYKITEKLVLDYNASGWSDGVRMLVKWRDNELEAIQKKVKFLNSKELKETIKEALIKVHKIKFD